MTNEHEGQAVERAISEHPCHGLFKTAGDRLTHRHWFQADRLMPTCERCGTLIDREHNEVGPVQWESPRAPPAPAAGEVAAAANIHAHEWEITAIWHKRRDALLAKWSLSSWASLYEGKCLPDRIAWGESMAREVLNCLKCDRVEIRRHAEGIYAEARA